MDVPLMIHFLDHFSDGVMVVSCSFLMRLKKSDWLETEAKTLPKNPAEIMVFVQPKGWRYGGR